MAAFNQPKFLAALFADDAVRNKRNTEAVEVAPRVLIAGRVLEYKPVTKTPMSEVKPILEEKVGAIEADKLAKQAGEAKLAELRKGGTATFGASFAVSRNKPGGLPPPALAPVMKADASKLPAYIGVALPGRGYSIYRINKISEDAADEATLKAEQQQVVEFLATQETAAFLGVIKKRAKAEILKQAQVVKPVPAAK